MGGINTHVLGKGDLFTLYFQSRKVAVGEVDCNSNARRGVEGSGDIVHLTFSLRIALVVPAERRQNPRR